MYNAVRREEQVFTNVGRFLLMLRKPMNTKDIFPNNQGDATFMQAVFLI